MYMPISDVFSQELQAIYERDPITHSVWDREKEALIAILEEVANQISFNYTMERPLNIGGGGVIVVVKDKNLDTDRILKLPRPSPGLEQTLIKILESETNYLQKFSHQNLIRIYARGSVDYKGNMYPFYIMEYIKKVKDSDKYILENAKSEDDFFNILYGTVQALEYLHRDGTIHMDIKPSNILVAGDGMPILSDFGWAKSIRQDDNFTIIGGTEGFIHPELRKIVQSNSDPNRIRTEILRSEIKVEFDLYALGKTIFKLLEKADEKKLLTPYSKRYIKLMAARLLDGYNNDEERALGLSLSTFKEIKYRNISECKIDIEKLIGTYNIENKIPELNSHPQDFIQITNKATAAFTKRTKSVVHTPEFSRLGNISQLGLLNLIYPTATHSRFEHSLGTFAILARYIRFLYYDQLNPLFKQIMTEEDLKALLVTALVHDIGQYPLAHDLEDVSKKMFSHEKVGKTILENPSGSLRKVIEDKNDGWGIKIERVIQILSAKPRSHNSSLKNRILHSLISGPIDADKIDYITRDSRNLELTFGDGIDLDRFLRTLTIVFRAEGDFTYAVLGIHEKGKIAAESVAFARYALYGSVYWHHAYRAFKVMLYRVALEILKDTKNTTQFSDELFDEIVHFKEEHIFQSKLFESKKGRSVPLKLKQINNNDLQMLDWLYNRTSEKGQELVDCILERKLFKRIFVLTKERSLNPGLWNKIVDFYKNKKEDPKLRLKLNERLQEEIIKQVNNKSTENVHSVVISDTTKNSFIADAQSRILILLDVPIAKEGSEIPLECVLEDDRRKVKNDEMKTATFKTSTVWLALQSNLQESIGKVRIYCSGEYADFLSVFLSREEIDSALSTAIDEVS
jgi:HD superfamily phosphohydrolase